MTLEPLAPQHADPLWAAARDAEVWRWMIVDASASRRVFDAWLEAALAAGAAGTEAPFAVVRTADGAAVGSTRYLSLRPEHRGLEIGYTWLGRDAWGTGANAEAKLLLLEHAFERHDALRVEFKTNARNVRARKALEALPARFEGIFRRHMVVREGTIRDSAWYAVTDEDWREVRPRLERRVAAYASGP